MGVVVCLSSQVARGYVGGSAARIALETLGHAVWLLPTVVLSNHPGHPLHAGEQTPPGRLRAMLEALGDNGWLAEADAVLTGYLPTPEHAMLAARAVEMVRAAHAGVQVLCDPILGDDPDGLYLDTGAAEAVRDILIPLADIATPNRFELEWLTGMPVGDAEEALAAMQTLGAETVLATSIPGGAADMLANLLAAPEGAWRTAVRRRQAAPHGAGDLLAALYLGQRLSGADGTRALALATAGVEAALACAGSDELELARPGRDWAAAEAWPVERVDG